VGLSRSRGAAGSLPGVQRSEKPHRHRWSAFASVAVTDDELAAHAETGAPGRMPVRCHDCGRPWPDDEPCVEPRRAGYPVDQGGGTGPR
jgi:hypothetical protein